MKYSINHKLIFMFIGFLFISYTSLAQTDLNTINVDVTQISRTLTDTSDVSFVIFKIDFSNTDNIKSIGIEIISTKDSEKILTKNIDITDLSKLPSDIVYTVARGGFTIKIAGVQTGEFYATFSIVTDKDETFSGQKFIRI